MTGATGAKGDTGITGATGLTDNTGAKGDTGLTDNTGATGAKGDTDAKGDIGDIGDIGDTGAYNSNSDIICASLTTNIGAVNSATINVSGEITANSVNTVTINASGQIISSNAFISGSLSINYTETYSNAIATTQTTWGGTTASNGKYLNIYATGGTIQQYKPNFFTLSTIFNIQNSSYNGFSFIDANYDGLYEIKISLLFKNTSSNVEFMPLIQISKTTAGTGTIQPQQHAMVATINHTNGKYATVSCRSAVQISANDIIKFVLGFNSGSNDVSTSSTTNFTVTNLSINIKYLGNYSLIANIYNV